MAHYRTIPTVIQAMQLTVNNQKEIIDFLNKDEDDFQVAVPSGKKINFGHRYGRTLNLFEWIVKHPSGLMEKLDTEAFKARYEPITGSI